ncbi:MAG: hypothetical protein MPJ50_12165 [Pirellulales bacterium]|nr:hypothetical protein [Pirellulales bacterium]
MIGQAICCRASCLLVTLAIGFAGCAQSVDSVLGESGVGKRVEDLAIFYWDTPEYRAYTRTFSITFDEARERIRQQGHFAFDHFVVVDRSYVFTLGPDKLARIPLSGYYVNGDTGEVIAQNGLPTLSFTDFKKRWGDRELESRPR